LDTSEDQTPPDLKSSSLVLGKAFVLEFNEAIQGDVAQIEFLFEPSVLIDSVFFGRETIWIYAGIEENVEYKLQVFGVRDCFGNVYSSADAIRYFLPSVAKAGDLAITELLFNAKTGDPKFVEIKNLTEKPLEIGSWKLGNHDAMGKVSSIRSLSAGSLVILPDSYLAITTDTARLRQAYPLSSVGNFHQLATLPSYPISAGTVVLLDPLGQVVETFGYKESMHHPLLRDPKGVSLERISIQTNISILSNWHSASGIENYATPGRKNSMMQVGEFDGEIINVDPAVFDPEGSNGLTFATIRYDLDQPGWVGSFRIYNLSGNIVNVLAENEILGAKGFFNWTGTDDRGVKVRAGYYVLLVELYDLSGAVKYVRKTLVVATRL
jgi:hypothetical protein